ncbi:hypothetical protein M422DRAFT_273119 [Sphaerobolus stellatus SS14]|uniref:Unplaced genomic scaffold SPHSTscaffold_319, whole genome shotgun sequence n=1 Tax=Sphaerobolus stellatus (strain SS14) TaxID=990650 RepID=A0A0C9TA07_SPHS4|nr:hypothetical protein M422DRAFT_273119 [Sphaerobolus stellatus SS14]
MRRLQLQTDCVQLSASFISVLADIDLGSMVFNLLGPGELGMLARVCKAVQLVVMYYRLETWSIRRTLRPWFPSLVEDFRSLMIATGSMISGMLALKFMGRHEWSVNELDLYVQPEYAEQVINWLCLKAGYRFTDVTYVRDFERSLILQGNANSDDRFHEYSDAHEVTFLRLEDDAGNVLQKIKVVKAFHSSIALILGSHSTYLMNFITGVAAYSLFPKLTFIEYYGVGSVNEDTATTTDRLHYKALGFETIGPRVPATSLPDIVKNRHRYVGDKDTWLLWLDHPTIRKFSLFDETIVVNNWMHYIRNKWYPNSGVTHPVCRIHYRAVADICLRFTYTIAVPFDEDVQAWIDYMRITEVRRMDRPTLTWLFRFFKRIRCRHPPPITHRNEWNL